jgi:hypothetical protein
MRAEKMGEGVEQCARVRHPFARVAIDHGIFHRDRVIDPHLGVVQRRRVWQPVQSSEHEGDEGAGAAVPAPAVHVEHLPRLDPRDAVVSQARDRNVGRHASVRDCQVEVIELGLAHARVAVSKLLAQHALGVLRTYGGLGGRVVVS